jgi:hypothetical protein
MFLSIGSEPVRSGAWAEGCLFETTDRLAMGEDAIDPDLPPGLWYE